MGIKPFPFSLSEVRQLLLLPDLSDSNVISCIKETQKNFTSCRESISEYVTKAEHVSSYSLFYMPTDFPKLSLILSQLGSTLIKWFEESKLDIYDIGCGPGTFSFAWRNYFSTSDHRFHLIDQSQDMLAQAQRFSSDLFCLPSFYTYQDLSKFTNEKKENPKVVIFGHSMNEMGTRAVNLYLNKIQPDFIFFIGPGTPTVFKLFMNWRRDFSDSFQMKVLYPCIGVGNCPMVDSDDWCHQILRSKLSSELHQLGQKLSIDRRSVPFIGHVYGKNKLPYVEGEYTLVRFLGKTKFSWRYQACPSGATDLIELELMKKASSKEQIDLIMSLQVGERINVKVIKEIAPDHLRVAII